MVCIPSNTVANTKRGREKETRSWERLRVICTPEEEGIHSNMNSFTCHFMQCYKNIMLLLSHMYVHIHTCAFNYFN